MKPLPALLVLAIASPQVALAAAQDAAPTDWSKEVEHACTSKRYGLRLAAAKKIGLGGAAAVPAVIAYGKEHGKNDLPVAIVEAIASQPTLEEPVLALLLEWATDRDFFWRAQAMKGLAMRAPLLPPARREPLQALFAAHRDDPAWLSRVHARLGLALLGDANITQAPEADPRAASKLTALLLQAGQVPPLQPLLDALADERTFLETPWGSLRAQEARQALETWLGDAAQKASLAQLLDAARKKSGQDLRLPKPATDPAVPFAGGFEILSCRSGDLFVRWTTAGELHFGIDGGTTASLPAPIWETLVKERAELPLAGSLGVVICDNLRMRWGPPDIHVKVAPGALPAAATKWFLHLAKSLAEADQPRLAETIRSGLEQFEPR